MQKLRRVAAAAFLSTLAAIGVAHADAARADPAVAAPASTGRVTIDNFTFAPAELTVPVGTTVIWVNHDDEPHTVVNDGTPRLFKSPALDTDENFSFVFTKPGIYKYFCSIHAHMTGTIIVR